MILRRNEIDICKAKLNSEQNNMSDTELWKRGLNLDHRFSIAAIFGVSS